MISLETYNKCIAQIKELQEKYHSEGNENLESFWKFQEKKFANTNFPVVGSPNFQIYDLKLAEEITKSGRELIIKL